MERALRVDFRAPALSPAAFLFLPERLPFMFRVSMIALLLAAGVAGCANGSSGHRAGPPQDPADYHGVPTDSRPPTMVPAPVAR
ncbi:MAG TPA: hypothetical protein VF573_30060 [Paraburkholderia sp.]|uniref:hypothetical protein n=1 Tax=Paraburkholderia sp. TaxID=1926495 RepID=UPI002ED50D8B